MHQANTDHISNYCNVHCTYKSKYHKVARSAKARYWLRNQSFCQTSLFIRIENPLLKQYEKACMYFSTRWVSTCDYTVFKKFWHYLSSISVLIFHPEFMIFNCFWSWEIYWIIYSCQKGIFFCKRTRQWLFSRKPFAYKVSWHK